jgi:hypothetical protein
MLRHFLDGLHAPVPRDGIRADALLAGRLLIQIAIGLSMATHCISRDFTLLNGALIWLFSCFI